MIELTVDKNADTPFYVQLGDGICDAIRAGKLMPEDRLPGEVELASELSVTRTTVSRAYELLRRKQIIVQKKGQGSFIVRDVCAQLRIPEARRIENVVIVLGTTDLTTIHSNLKYVTLNYLGGMSDVLGADRVHFRFAESMTVEGLGRLDHCDAIVLEWTAQFEASVLHDLAQRGMPVVSMGTDESWPGMAHVLYDRYEVVRLACRHLIECGYGTIGFVGPTGRADHRHEGTFLGYVKALLDAQLPVEPQHIIEADLLPGSAYSEMTEFLQKGRLPSAFIVRTGYAAMEVVRVLAAHGHRVPEDIGVVGLDDPLEAAGFTPSLTAVHIPWRQIGRRAAEMLVHWPLEGAPDSDIIVPCELKVRGSTRKLNSHG